MKDKLKAMPMIVTLTAGAVVIVLSTLAGYALRERLLFLIASILFFYIVSCIIEGVIRRFAKANEERLRREGEIHEKQDEEAVSADG